MRTKVIKLQTKGRWHATTLLLLLLGCGAVFTGVAQLRGSKRVTSVHSGSTADGSRVTVTADSALNDYEAFRRGDRFYVRIPAADITAAQPRFTGDGYEDVQVLKIGDGLVLSFRLQPGTTAHVDQSANKLDVIFSSPSKARSALGNNPSVPNAATIGLERWKNPAAASREERPKSGEARTGSPQAGVNGQNPNSTLPGAPTLGVTANSSTAPASDLPTSSAGVRESLPPQSEFSQANNPQPATGTSLPGMARELAAWLTRDRLISAFAVLLLGGIAIWLATRTRLQAKSARKAELASPSPRKLERPRGETKQKRLENVNVPAAVTTSSNGLVEEPHADRTVPAEGKITAAPPADPSVTTEEESDRQEKVDIARSKRISHVSEGKALIPEEPSPTPPIPCERIHVELKKLLAGREYDVQVVDAKDSATRQLVLKELLAILHSRNYDAHKPARRALVAHGYFDEATHDLRTADSPAERVAAARRLGLMADSQATTHLVAALLDTAPEVRRAAVESLGQIGESSAIGPLNDLLLRETSRQLPEAVIRHSINSITVSAAKQNVEEQLPAHVSEKSAARIVSHKTERDAFIQYLDSLNLRKAHSPTPTVSPAVSDAIVATAELSLAVDLALDAEEQQLRLEEEALRRAAAELEQRRSEAEVARKQAEESARLNAEKEAQARLEVEDRIRSEEAARKQAEEDAERLKAEEETRLQLEAQEQAEKEAQVRAEEEAQFQLEAQTLRRAAEELARKRAEAEAARQTAAEEARQRAEEEARVGEEARLQAEAEERQRAEEEARVAEEVRLQAEAEERQRAEEEAFKQTQEKTRIEEAGKASLEEEEQRLLLEVESRRQVEEERLRLEQETLIRAAIELSRRRTEIENARKRRSQETRLLAETRERIKAEQEKARQRAEEKRQRVEKTRRSAEEQQRAIEEEARQQAEELARLEAIREQAKEEARLRAEQEEQLRAEIEALRQAEEEQRQRMEAEAQHRAEAEARLKEEEQRRQAEAEARMKAEAEARLLAEEARQLAESQERLRAEEEQARQRAEGECQRLEETRRHAEEQQRAIEEEARRHGEELARLEAIREQAKEEARQRAEQEEQLRAEIEALRQAEEEQRQRMEAEAQHRAEVEARLKEEEQRRQAEAEARANAESEADSQGFIIQNSSEFNYQKTGSAESSWVEVEISRQGIETHNLHGVNTEKAIQPAAESHVPIKELDILRGEKGIAQLADESGIPSDLMEKLKSNESTERAAALTDIARIGGDDAFHNISKAFDDSSPDVRNAAARALHDLQPDRAASFTRALREGSPERRRRIGAALAASGLASDAISNLTGESREKTYDAFSLLFLMAKAGEVQPLMRAIEEYPEVEARLAVVKLLALSGQSEIVPAFRRLAVRGSLPAEVRSAVMEAIYQISSQARETAPSVA